MKLKMDKARKQLSIWGETAARLKALSEQTGESQTELIHQAVLALEYRLAMEKERENVG